LAVNLSPKKLINYEITKRKFNSQLIPGRWHFSFVPPLSNKERAHFQRPPEDHFTKRRFWKSTNYFNKAKITMQPTNKWKSNTITSGKINKWANSIQANQIAPDGI